MHCFETKPIKASRGNAICQMGSRSGDKACGRMSVLQKSESDRSNTGIRRLYIARNQVSLVEAFSLTGIICPAQQVLRLTAFRTVGIFSLISSVPPQPSWFLLG